MFSWIKTDFGVLGGVYFIGTATSIATLILLGIYRKNRFTLAVLIIAIPLIWLSIAEANNIHNPFLFLGASVIAVAITAVFARELKRNWHQTH